MSKTNKKRGGNARRHSIHEGRAAFAGKTNRNDEKEQRKGGMGEGLNPYDVKRDYQKEAASPLTLKGGGRKRKSSHG